MHKKIIIALDDSSDEEEMADIKDVHNIQVHISNQPTEVPIADQQELHRLNEVLSHACKFIVSEPQSAESVSITPCDHLKNNVITNNEEFDKLTFEFKQKNKHILIPFFDTSIHFNNIKWLKTPSNSRLLQLVEYYNPAKWIVEDATLLLTEKILSMPLETRQNMVPFYSTDMIEYGKNLAAEKKEAWINFINTKLVSECPLINEPYFFILEFAYLKNASFEKGLCGMSITYCKLRENGTIEVIDFANIKISVNFRNPAYAGFFSLLEKDTTAPIFVYVPQNTSIGHIFTTSLWPWSSIFHNQAYRMYNLISKIQLRPEDPEAMKTFCIDNKTHAPACSNCNIVNLLTCLGTGEYKVRPNTCISPVFDQSYIDHNLPMPNYITCKHITYVEYGFKSSSSTTKMCFCKN